MYWIFLATALVLMVVSSGFRMFVLIAGAIVSGLITLAIIWG
jgi:hypothetical protein